MNNGIEEAVYHD